MFEDDLERLDDGRYEMKCLEAFLVDCKRTGASFHVASAVPIVLVCVIPLSAFALGTGLSATSASGQEADASTRRGSGYGLAVPNDNRTPAGTLRDGVLELELEARPARWDGEGSDLDPEAVNPTIVDVLGFAEEGGPVTIPGPLVRVPQGTEVRIRLRNSIPADYPIGLPLPGLRQEGMRSVADDVLRVRGLRAGTVPDDLLEVARGEVAEVRYRADVPGTYFYWATPSPRPIEAWTGSDAQLTGAIVVDPEGVAPDPEERIFVITMLDQYPDPDASSSQGEYFRRAINGRSWPDTERFEYPVGETVRWRWINASFEFHPMHLHGFHYLLLARGDATSETVLPENERPLIVTEHMTPGSTFRMEWMPTRAGNWIFHCHLLDHIVPAMERDEAEREHDLLDIEQHAFDAMAGLVVGMTVAENGPDEAEDEPRQRLRLLALELRGDDGTMKRGFGLERSAEETIDVPGVPGPPLLLTRGETTEINVVNRLSVPTTIHWHGLELESVFDGVAGWSRTGSRVAPLIAPGESFAVRIRPPRAGTFIYHTHMDETDQLVQGMVGPFLVLEPGEEYDPEHDRVFVIGGQVEGDYPTTINGRREPPMMSFRAGETYRLRFVHITMGQAADIAMTMNGSAVRWRAVAKDGADLPEALRLEDDAVFVSNTGQTFDFMWTPTEAGEGTLSVTHERFFQSGDDVVRLPLRVHGGIR
jgi:FtsP/CotA-like multicopper oxidase with cupredoxin domain